MEGGIRITIQKIAELAGVSKTTVSRVLNKRPDVNPETRKRVERVIQESNYYPNSIAQAFSQQKSRSIGLVFPDNEVDALSNPYYAELMGGLLEEARAKNYHVILSYLMNEDSLNMAKKKAVDGLILLTPRSEHREKIEELLEIDIPLVSTSRILGLNNLHYVAVDEYRASCEIVEHLIALGHRKIALIDGPKTLYSSCSRLLGYQKTLEKHGITYDPSLVAFGDTSVTSGSKLMGNLIESGNQVTAVFACSDLMAIGAKHAIEAHGMRVPNNISLVSSDSTAISDYLDAPLTTLKQPTHERGILAMRMLIDMIEGRPVKNQIVLPMGIVIKKTTGAVID